jgi:hypothetical protein
MTAPMKRPELQIDGATLIFKNFAGREREFNEQGKRNFSILLTEEVARPLMAERWNVKEMRKLDPDSEQMYHLPVTVSYKVRPPAVFLITSRGKSPLGEDLVEEMDNLAFTNVDVIVNGYDWFIERTKKGGRKAYLQTMFATMYEDALMQRYMDVPTIGAAQEQAMLEQAALPEGRGYELEGAWTEG